MSPELGWFHISRSQDVTAITFWRIPIVVAFIALKRIAVTLAGPRLVPAAGA
jgi:hypothetical protein